MQPCLRCGQSFAFVQGLRGGRPRKYCSEDCAEAAWAKPKVATSCVDCGGSVSSGHAKRCDACNKELRRVDAWQRKTRGKVLTCPACRSQFCPLRGTSINKLGSRSFCSDGCKRAADIRYKRVTKRRRRARIKGSPVVVSVDKELVFERDSWTCCACGCSTPRSLMGTIADDAPEHDHVIALARGGEHTYENSQTLCRVCNILKADGDWFEFLSNYGAAGARAQADLWWRRAALTVLRSNPKHSMLEKRIRDICYDLNTKYRGGHVSMA